MLHKYKSRQQLRHVVLGISLLLALLGLRWWDRNRGWVRPCSHQEAALAPEEIARIFDENAEASAHTGDGGEVPLYKLAMFGMDSEQDYRDLVTAYTRRLAIRPGNSVFESGCGTGAFLQVVQDLYGTQEHPLALSGTDFSDKALKVASKVLGKHGNGLFTFGLVQNLSGVPSNTFDAVLSFSVFGYLPTERDATLAADEMLRVAKPGGQIFIGNVNDAAKLGYADCMGTQRSFFSKEFWIGFAAARQTVIQVMEIVDGYDVWRKTIGYDITAPVS